MSRSAITEKHPSINPSVALQDAPQDKFRSIHWRILSLKKEKWGLTQNDKLFLSVLSHYADENGKTPPLSYKTIEFNMGPTPNPKNTKSKNPEARVQKYARRLERISWIIRIPHSGKFNSFIIANQAIYNPNEKSLSLGKEIFNLCIPTGKKYTLACRTAFKEMSIKTMSERLGVSEDQIKDDLIWLRKSGYLPKNNSHPLPKPPYTPPTETPLHPLPKPPMENPHQTQGLYGSDGYENGSGIVPTVEEKLGIAIISKDMIKHLPAAAHQSVVSSLTSPIDNNSKPLQGDREMQTQQTPSNSSSPRRTSQSSTPPRDIRMLDIGLPAEQQRDKKQPPPIVESLELRAIRKYTHITQHTIGTIAYATAIKITKTLAKAGKGLSPLQREQFIKIHSEFATPQIEEFLDKPFDKKERQELYSRLNEYCAYNNKRLSIADAFKSFQKGYCLFMELWINKPQPKAQRATVKVDPELSRVAHEFFYKSNGSIDSIVAGFERYYNTVIQSRLESMGVTNWSLSRCFDNFMEKIRGNLEGHEIRPESVGLIKIDKEPFKKWEPIFWAKIKKQIADDDFRKWNAEKCVVDEIALREKQKQIAAEESDW